MKYKGLFKVSKFGRVCYRGDTGLFLGYFRREQVCFMSVNSGVARSRVQASEGLKQGGFLAAF